MATPKRNESARVRKLIAGANLHLSNIGSLMLGNVPYTMSALLSLFSSYADLFDAVQAAKAAYLEKLKAQRTQASPVRVVLALFVDYVRATFGDSPQVLNDFGLSPRKVRKTLTSEEQAAAVQKRDATRAARHTQGKRQKAKIHGSAPEPAPTGGSAAPEPGTPSPAPAPVNGSEVHGPKASP